MPNVYGADGRVVEQYDALNTVGQPHSKYQHVFVVVRIDAHEGVDDDFDADRLAVTNVFSSEEAAAADAARLNELADERGVRSRYVTRVGRLRED